MSSQKYMRLIGLKVYTLGAKYLGEVRDVGLSMDDDRNPVVYILVGSGDKSLGVPVSSIKAIGDIILLSEDYANNLVEVEEEPKTTTRLMEPLGNSALHHAAPVVVEDAVIPRCPRCGSALVYDPRKKKWYCPRCKEHVKLDPAIEAKVPRCPYCGTPLSYIEQYGKWYCYNCRRYIDIGAGR